MANPHVAFPKSAPGAGALGVGGPGLMYYLKENGYHVPPLVVTVVGVASAILLIIAAIQFARWVWYSGKEHLADPNSLLSQLAAQTRRRLIPLMLGTMAIAGALLIGAAILGAIAYSNSSPPNQPSDVAQTPAPQAAPAPPPLNPSDAAKVNKALSSLLAVMKPKMLQDISKFHSAAQSLGDGMILSLSAAPEQLQDASTAIAGDEKEITSVIDGMNDAYVIDYLQKIVTPSGYKFVGSNDAFEIQIRDYIAVVNSLARAAQNMPDGLEKRGLTTALRYPSERIEKAMTQYTQWTRDTIAAIETEQRKLRK